jgi:apolipoprotein D and lipocalin family protein
MKVMKNLLSSPLSGRFLGPFAAAFTAGVLMLQSARGDSLPLKTVPFVDVSRYMGDWNVIANIPNFIEKDCVSSVESYALRSDGKIDNWFVCHKSDGSQTRLTSLAWVYNRQTNAEWRVQFNLNTWLGSIPVPIPFSYLVLDLDTESYSYSVVGHPSRNLLWIMARERHLDDHIYQGILARVKQQGYDLSKVVKLSDEVK